MTQHAAPLRLVDAEPLERLARTLEALLVIASAPLSTDELAAAAEEDEARVEAALHLARRALFRRTQRHRARARRRRLRLPGSTGGSGRLRASRRAAGRARALAGGARDARHRRVPRPVHAPRHRPRFAAWPPTRSSPGSSSAGSSSRPVVSRARRRRPLSDDRAVRAGLRARGTLRAAAARRSR